MQVRERPFNFYGEARKEFEIKIQAPNFGEIKRQDQKLARKIRQDRTWGKKNLCEFEGKKIQVQKFCEKKNSGSKITSLPLHKNQMVAPL